MSSPPPPPLSRLLRPFTTRILNPLARQFVHHLPGYALIGHRGRQSGRIYWTPINVFRHGDTYVFALTYGSDVDWVQNVVASGKADLRVGDAIVHLVEPELFVDPQRRDVPVAIRLLLGLMQVSEFLRMRVAQPASESSGAAAGARG